MNSINQDDVTHIEYRTLFIICKYCFIISILIIPISIVVFFSWPLYPDNILDVMMENKLGGVFSLDFIYFIGTFVSIPITLLYYLTTKKINKSLSLLALTIGFIGLVSLYASRPVLEMARLSEIYKNAEPGALKNELETISLVLMLFFKGTAFNIHYILGNLSLLISSFLMLRNKYYSKSIAYTGIITIVLSFTYFIPVVGVYITTVSVAGYIVWWILMILKLRNYSGIKI